MLALQRRLGDGRHDSRRIRLGIGFLLLKRLIGTYDDGSIGV
jgi:hypothetical protein